MNEVSNNKKIAFEIDGVHMHAEKGMTIMEAADSMGIRIPRL